MRFSVAISLICSELISVLTTLESVCTARASGFHSDGLRFGADGQFDVDAGSLGDVDHDAVLLEGLEALGRDLQVVVSRVQAVDVVQTGRAAVALTWSGPLPDR